MFKYADVREVHLEISSRCNASCPECPRNLRGGDVEDHGDYVVHDMSLSEAQQIFSREFLKQLRLITINGNYGDFIACRDGLKIVQYFAEANPNIKIEISTNASGQPKIWSVLGAMPQISNIMFRLDGLRDTHHLYRQYTDFDFIIRNAQQFIAAGGHATWAMIKFDFNLHQIAEAEQMSKELGFKRFELVDGGRDQTVVFTRDGVYSHTIGHPEPEIRNYQELLDMRDYFRSRDGHGEYYQSRVSAKKIVCQVEKSKSIYVQSNGQVYPCCWTGFHPDTNKLTAGMDQSRALSKGTNYALEVGIESAMQWFEYLAKTWQLDTVAQGRHYKCNTICGVND